MTDSGSESLFKAGSAHPAAVQAVGGVLQGVFIRRQKLPL